MKKRVFIVIFLLLLVLTGGFLLLDKFYFHFVFKVTPGSCLILEEKYCKKAKVFRKEDGKLIGAVFSVDPKTPIMSPVSEKFSGNISKDDNKTVIIGNNVFENDNETNLRYRISFYGDIKNDLPEKITKGTIFGYTKKKDKTDSWVFLAIEDMSVTEGELNIETNESEFNKLVKEQ